MVAFAFNAQQHEPKYTMGGGLPVGDYVGIISETEAKPTKNGKGGYAQFTLKAIEGPNAGGTQWDNLNLWNESAQAVEIANKQLSAYCHVLNKHMIQDTQELCNIPFKFSIRQQKNNPEYTEVGAIYDINGNEPGKAGAPSPVTAAPPPQAAPPAQVTAASPWPTQAAPAAVPEPVQAAPAPAAAWPGAAAPAASGPWKPPGT